MDPADPGNSSSLRELPAQRERSKVTFPTCRALPYGLDHMRELHGSVGDSHVDISDPKQARHNMTQHWDPGQPLPPDTPRCQRRGGSASQPSVTEQMQFKPFTSASSASGAGKGQPNIQLGQNTEGPWSITDLPFPFLQSPESLESLCHLSRVDKAVQ